MTLLEAITKYVAWRKFEVKTMTANGEFTDLRQFCLSEKNPDLRSVTLDLVMAHLQMMRDLSYGQHALYHRSMSLRAFFGWTKRMGYTSMDGGMVPQMKIEFKFPRVLSDGDYQKLTGAIPYGSNDPRHVRNLAMVSLIWDTGVRVGELCSIDLKDLDLERKFAHIKTAKSRGKKPMRQIMWTDETNGYIKEWLKARARLSELSVFRQPEALWVGISGWQAGSRLTPGAFCVVLGSYSKKAGIPRVNAHSFRHHMGRDLAMKGANNSTISSILGHSNVNSSFIYTTLDDRQLEEQYRKFKGD